MAHGTHSQQTPDRTGERAPQSWKPAFFTIWSGQALSLLGSMLVQFALVWWLTERTGSATVLAMATLAALLPQIFVGPVAGALVDRWNRRLVMIVADSGIALATLALVGLFAADLARPWHIYVIMAIRALGSGFHWPAMQSSTSLMVPPEHLARVAGLNEMLNGGWTIVAPPLGALLLEALPVQAVLAIDIGTAALAVLPLLFIPVPQPPRRAESGQEVSSLRQELIAGLRYVLAWRGLTILMGFALMIKFCLVPAFSLMPILVTDHFGGGASDLGWMQAVFGVGVVVGGALLGAWGGFRRRMVTSLSGLTGMGLGLVLLGLTPGSAFGAGLAAAAVAGLMESFHAGPFFATLQATVAPEMQGRVLSLFGSLTSLAVPISLGVAGPVADAWGAPVWYLAAGALCVLMGTSGLFIPALAGLDSEMAGNSPAAEGVVLDAAQ